MNSIWNRKRTAALACACLVSGGLASAYPVIAQKKTGPLNVEVGMMSAEGKRIGTVEVRQLAHGVALVVDVQGLSPGAHGFHIHERGVCKPSDFKSAGGHYTPRNNAHGFDSAKGYHAGDLPNLHFSQSGEARAEFHTMLVTLATQSKEKAGRGAPFPLADADGSALIIHEKADDYQAKTPDSTGARIACGVIAVPR